MKHRTKMSTVKFQAAVDVLLCSLHQVADPVVLEAPLTGSNPIWLLQQVPVAKLHPRY